MSAAHISVINAEESVAPLIRNTNFILSAKLSAGFYSYLPSGSDAHPAGGTTWTVVEQSFTLKFPDGVVVMAGRRRATNEQTEGGKN